MSKWGQPAGSEQPELLPDSIAELEETRLVLMEDIAGIEAQLAQRKADMDAKAAAGNRFDKYGKPLNEPAEYAEYLRWRGSAAGAKRWKQIELTNVKAAIRDIRARRGLVGDVASEVQAADNPVQMLAVLLKVTRRLAGRIGHDKMDVRDQEIIDSIESYLANRA